MFYRKTSETTFKYASAPFACSLLQVDWLFITRCPFLSPAESVRSHLPLVTILSPAWPHLPCLSQSDVGCSFMLHLGMKRSLEVWWVREQGVVMAWLPASEPPFLLSSRHAVLIHNILLKLLTMVLFSTREAIKIMLISCCHKENFYDMILIFLNAK